MKLKWRETDHEDSGEIEALIQRAAVALFYANKDEVLARFVSEGIKAEKAYNAVIAGSLLRA